MIRQGQAGVEIDVRVIPRAHKSTVAGERDGRLLVRLCAPPLDGAANAALIELVSSTFDLPRRSVRIVSGEKSREKRVALDGITLEQARLRLSECMPR